MLNFFANLWANNRPMLILLAILVHTHNQKDSIFIQNISKNYLIKVLHTNASAHQKN